MISLGILSLVAYIVVPKLLVAYYGLWCIRVYRKMPWVLRLALNLTLPTLVAIALQRAYLAERDGYSEELRKTRKLEVELAWARIPVLNLIGLILAGVGGAQLLAYLLHHH